MPQARDQRRHLVPRQLPAFPRLRPLGHLDLELVRTHQVLRRHAEAPRGDLLDPVVGAVAARSERYAARWRATMSSAISANPMPPMVETVPVKQRSTTSAPSPNASKICAPQYEESVEIPIFERTLRSPFSAAARNLFC